MCKYHNRKINGVYHTPVRNNPFFVRVINNQIHCYTGRQFHGSNEGEYNDRGNVVFNTLNVICDSIKYLQGREWVRIRSAQDQAVENTFENFLRPYSNVHRLGSFLPPILFDGLQIVSIEKRPIENGNGYKSVHIRLNDDI